MLKEKNKPRSTSSLIIPSFLNWLLNTSSYVSISLLWIMVTDSFLVPYCVHCAFFVSTTAPPPLDFFKNTSIFRQVWTYLCYVSEHVITRLDAWFNIIFQLWVSQELELEIMGLKGKRLIAWYSSYTTKDLKKLFHFFLICHISFESKIEDERGWWILRHKKRR